jgi:hypothetical protein
MFIKKKKEGGFINPAYEKFERIMGILVLCLIVVLFLTFLVMAIIDMGADGL